jgi:hypothetical protein
MQRATPFRIVRIDHEQRGAVPVVCRGLTAVPPTVLICRNFLRPVSTSRFQNQIRNRLRLGYQRNVTRLDLDRLGAHSLCHEALEIRVNGTILGGHGVPARL